MTSTADINVLITRTSLRPGGQLIPVDMVTDATNVKIMLKNPLQLKINVSNLIKSLEVKQARLFKN